MFRHEDGFNMYATLSAEEKAQQVASMNEASERLNKKLAEERVEDEKKLNEKIATAINFIDWAKTVNEKTKLSNSFEDTTVKEMLIELGTDANQYWVKDGEVFNKYNSYNIVGFKSEQAEKPVEEKITKEQEKINLLTEFIKDNPTNGKGYFNIPYHLFKDVNDELRVAIINNKAVIVDDLNRITARDIINGNIISDGKAGLFIGKAGCVIRTLSAIAGRRLEVK